MKTSILAAISAASLACLSVGPAMGQMGNCTSTTKGSSSSTTSKFSVRTIVINETEDLAFFVAIFRNDQNIKNKGKLTQEDPKIQTTMNGKANKTIAVETEIHSLDDRPDQKKMSCNYDVYANYVSANTRFTTTWTPDSSSCGDLETICPDNGCKIDCDLSYNSSNQRWTTTYTITDP